jgi:hypothetical protein
LIADARLYFLSPIPGVEQDIIAAMMNSSLVEFFVELAGRVTMGDGALELKVEDASHYLLVPDVRRFDDSNRQLVSDAFKPLLQRPIGSVFDEIQKPDRQALDRAVLAAIGLDADEWLPRLYDGLTTLVRERVELGRKRNQSRSTRTQKAAGRVAEEVVNDLLPNGVQHFPDDFLTQAARIELREIPLPEKLIQHKGAFFGQEEMSDNEGTTFMLKNMYEVRYVLYAQANGQHVVYIPQKMVEVTRSVNLYNQYLRDLRQGLYEAYFRRTLDQMAANRFVEDAWRKLKLPSIE